MPLDPLPDWVPTRLRDFEDHLRALRRTAGLSQIQLGERVGRDHKTIHRWETGITVPDLIDLLLLAHALGVAPADLFADE